MSEVCVGGPVRTRLEEFLFTTSSPDPKWDALRLLGDEIDRLRAEMEGKLVPPRDRPMVIFDMVTGKVAKSAPIAGGESETVSDTTPTCGSGESVVAAAKALFDNRLGWSDGRAPYAPKEFWADLGAALYGEDDGRVCELRAILDEAEK